MMFDLLAPNGLRYLRWGGWRNASDEKKAEAKKMPEKRADSPASSAPEKMVGPSFFPRETAAHNLGS
jgi:hypothetical protein